MLSSAPRKRLSPHSRHRAPPVPQFPLLGGSQSPPGHWAGVADTAAGGGQVGARWLPGLRNCR